MGLAGLLCTACPNPNTFSTARTVPVGEVSHSLSIETIGEYGVDNTVAPTPPSYQARVGVAERADIGLHFSHFSSIGVDFKYNPVRSEVFDFAVDPMAQGVYVPSEQMFVGYLQLPLLFDLNLSETTSIVLSPGISYYATKGVPSGTEFTYPTSLPLFRAGIGFDFRTSKRFALHPDFTFLFPFEDRYAVMFLAGIGLNFGALPDFGQ